MNTLWIIIFAGCSYIPKIQGFFSKSDNIFENFNWIELLQTYGVGVEYPFLYPLWFLRNLLILNVFAIVIKKIIDFAPKTSILIVCIVFLFLHKFPLNNFIGNFCVSDLCMWCFGYFVVKYKVNINKLDGNKIIFILFFAFLIVRIAIMGITIPVLKVVLSRCSLVINIIFWYSWFSKSIGGTIKQLFIRFSCYNFAIYLFHEMNLTLFKKIMQK